MVDGSIAKGKKVMLPATLSCQPLDVGHHAEAFAALGRRDGFVTGLKDITSCRVGDDRFD